MPHSPEYETAVPCTLRKMLKAGKYYFLELCLVLEIVLLVYYPILYKLDVQGQPGIFNSVINFLRKNCSEAKAESLQIVFLVLPANNLSTRIWQVDPSGG